MITLNPHEISFPDPEKYHPPGGLIAAGGDLSVERVYFAYETGLFPWYNPGEEILWWCPDPRFVMFPDELKVSRSMQKIMNRELFRFTENQCFRTVMEHCMRSERKHQDGTWINEDLIDTFTRLHEMGVATSIEVWQNDALAGGLYGVQMGGVFCGESMFSLVSNASKAGFIYFVQKYRHQLDLIDCQIHSDHLESLGARMISKAEYLKILKNSNESR